MVNEAARVAGVGRRTVYDRRSRDEDFKRAWDEALEAAIERLEVQAIRRAMDGSDRLMMFVLRARRPEVYVERYQVQKASNEQKPMVAEISDPEVQKASNDFLRAVNAARSRRLAKEGAAK